MIGVAPFIQPTSNKLPAIVSPRSAPTHDTPVGAVIIPRNSSVVVDLGNRYPHPTELGVSKYLRKQTVVTGSHQGEAFCAFANRTLSIIGISKLVL